MAVLGHDLVHLDRLTDNAHCLRLKEAQRIESALEEFERRFPQVFVSVYLGVLPQTLTLNELTFWLLNHAAFNTRDMKKLNEYAVALVIDPAAKGVALNVGYALEAALPEKRLISILGRLRTPLWHGEYVNAILLALDGIEKYLRKSARRMTQREDIVPPGSAEEFLHGSGLRPSRQRAASSVAEVMEEAEDLPASGEGR
ncbi:MAG: TPM domain-containing protein [Chthoniobacteraceae bacterium]